MSYTVRFASISLALLFVATAWAAPGGAPTAVPGAVRHAAAVVAYVPAADRSVDAALRAGLRAGLAPWGVRLVVGRSATHWSNAAPETVRLISEEGAQVLITPPGRRVAHLMAQVATRTGVALVSTSSAPTVGATGSRWVTCLADVGARADWRTVGRRAARAALAHLARR